MVNRRVVIRIVLVAEYAGEANMSLVQLQEPWEPSHPTDPGVSARNWSGRFSSEMAA